MTISRLLQLLACPVCREGALLGLDEGLADGTLTCERCRASYPVRGGIPILLPPERDTPNALDETAHLREGKRRQADYFDRHVAEEFEITRPSGAPPAYRWLMAEKFRRGIGLLPALRGATVLDACCGSGMDAEFLAGEGADVIALDISEGCAARALARARRRGLDYLVVVGDVERLPVRSGAVDIGYVHDGLHHLPNPAVGIRELARVARRAVSVNEPADALATRLAVRLGIALVKEASGNVVARLRAEDVRSELASAGFRVAPSRYFMYYKHEPGKTMGLVSRPGIYHLFRAAAALANLAIGRWGNKLQVTAVRADATGGGRAA